MDAILGVVFCLDDPEPALDEPGEQTAEEDRRREIERKINPDCGGEHRRPPFLRRWLSDIRRAR
jgi:hypothetical protein